MAQYSQHLPLKRGLNFVEALALLSQEEELLREQLVALLAQSHLLGEPGFVFLNVFKIFHCLYGWNEDPKHRRELSVRVQNPLLALKRQPLSQARKELLLLRHVDQVLEGQIVFPIIDGHIVGDATKWAGRRLRVDEHLLLPQLLGILEVLLFPLLLRLE